MSYTKLQRFDGETIYVGIDTHLKSWKVNIQSKEFELKTYTQPPDAQNLMNYLTHHYPGANYECVYESLGHGNQSGRHLS